MTAGTCCRRPALTVKHRETLRAAARRMERDGVGSLVVVEDGRPVGVVTDRDVALAVLADGLDPGSTAGARVAGRGLAAVREEEPLRQAIAAMRRDGVRRLPVVDGAGGVVGLLAADDLVRLAAQELAALADVAAEQAPASARPAAGVPGCERGARHYAKEVTAVPGDTTLCDVARRMRAAGVGCVVVLGETGAPCGLVTDRDLALRAVARELDPRAPVSRVASAPVVAVDASEGLQEVARTMGREGVRRLPVVEDGRLVGIVTYDDLLVAIGAELHDLGEAALAAAARELRGGGA
jgi:CBS domain-containing protein